MSAPTLSEQIFEIERALGVNKIAYPRHVHNRLMTQAEADVRIARLEAVLATLRRVQAEQGMIARHETEKTHLAKTL
jgi:hypothetical protein